MLQKNVQAENWMSASSLQLFSYKIDFFIISINIILNE